MKILILELGGSHIECAYSFAHFLQMHNHEVFLCCNKKLIPLYPEVELLAGSMAVADDLTGLQQFFSYASIRKYIRKNKITHLVINTTEIKTIRNFSFFIPRKMNCTALVHNAKKLERSSTFIHILSKKIRKYFVLGDYLLEQIKPYKLFEVESFFPVYFPKATTKTILKPADEFWVITPGEVNANRRDYLPLINEVMKGRIKKDIRFILLGKFLIADDLPAGTMNSELWKQQFIYFNEQVAYDLFHEFIKLADVILPLIKLENDDMYADSRISGSFNLGLGYQKPFLLPVSFKKNSDLAPYSFYYDTIPGLINLIQDLFNDKVNTDVIQSNYSDSPYADLKHLAEKTNAFIFK